MMMMMVMIMMMMMSFFLLGLNQVLPGVAQLVEEVQVEGTFPDGTKLVSLLKDRYLRQSCGKDVRVICSYFERSGQISKWSENTDYLNLSYWLSL